MSIKDLFSKNNKIVSSKDSETLGEEVESEKYIKEKFVDQGRFEPHVDYATASNFAFYGSAEKYYKDGFDHITSFYPYDGAAVEKQEFLNSLSDIGRYIYDYEYPRTNGHAIFSADGWGTAATKVGAYGGPNSSADYEYITIIGGPHTASGGMAGKSLSTTFTGSNIYSTDIYADEGQQVSGRKGSRLSNLRLYPEDGTTVEFWLKKREFLASSTNREVIFDLWNGDATSSAAYGRFTIELSGGAGYSASPFRLTYQSGTYGIFDVAIGSDLTTSTVADNAWRHYAVSIHSASSGLKTQLYVNGDLNETVTYTGSVNAVKEITGSLKAHIGALRTAPSGNTYSGDTSVEAGWAKFSGSLDEFRYWKVRRTSKEIGRNWFTQVHGGSNTDIANADLGVYYKFNEGITTTSSVDSIVLDYSGRISNGTWTGYGSNSRSTESAITAASAASSEFLDPIIRPHHPDVKSSRTNLALSGSLHDQDNNASLLYSIPAWILEEDNLSGNTALENLVQMIGSFFDQMHLLIKEMPRIKEPKYYTSGSKPYPFASNMLQHFGLTAPEIFVDATILEQILARDEDREFKDTLVNVKNLIYQNIYNNLVYIYKTKGTEKSIRNLLRCYGIGDDIIKFNIYSDNQTYTYKPRYRTTTVKKNYVDFHDPDKFESIVYQFSDPDNSNTVSFISGTLSEAKEDYMEFTAEAEAFFPVHVDISHPNHFRFANVTSSIYGMHTAVGTTPADTTWSDPDYANFQVLTVRPDVDSNDLYFKLTSSNSPHPLPTLTSSLYKGVYNSQKWNLAVSMYPDKVSDRVSGSTDNSGPTYTVEFAGVHMTADIVEDEFKVTGSIAGSVAKNFLHSAKRMYIGANRTNFTGSAVYSTDSRIGSLRYWSKYLPINVIKDHARDPANSGVPRPYESAYLNQTSLTESRVPNIDTLILHWDFSNVTGSSADASDTTSKDSIFYVNDVSSGSSQDTSRYGWFGNLSKNQHSGKGNFFLPPDSGDVNPIDKTYLAAYRQQLPEIVSSADMVNILDDDDKNFAREKDLVNIFYSLEKSMYQTISEEMINMFSSIVDFNNLVGEPVNRYRAEYKDLSKLRQLFFERVRNTPDLDKYLEFYKWIDSSLNIFIEQLVPASANISEKVRTMVESHVLERNKFQTKFPTIEFKTDDPEAGLRGITELTYNWKFGHAPVDTKQANNADWWKDRIKRGNGLIATSDSNINSDKENARKVINTHRTAVSQQVSDTIGNTYSGSVYALRKFTKPYRFSVYRTPTIHGGVNFQDNKNLDYVRSACHPGGPVRQLGVGSFPQNVMLLDTEDKIYGLKDINDVKNPNELKKYTSKVVVGRDYEDSLGYGNSTGEHILPFNIISSSVTTGYNAYVVDRFKAGSSIVNLHNDVYGHRKEKPMQGPFTEAWVGGLQYRHIDVNRATSTRNLDDEISRPEGWVILLGDHPSAPPTSDGILGIVGPDYPHPEVNHHVGADPYPSFYPKAVYTRDGLAKRPVNIANIKYDTGSANIGNYSRNYEILTLNGRKENNLFVRKNEGISLPAKIHNAGNMKATTNVHTLAAVTPHVNSKGNVAIGPFPAAIRGARYDLSSEPTQFTLPERGTLTASNTTVITSRFSAPGSNEVMSRGYLDIASEEYSVYNAMPFRNLSVLSSGSGEAGYMRVNSHIGYRDGLRTLLRRHCGRYGIDSVYGAVSATSYDSLPSFHKINRNAGKRIERQSAGGHEATTTLGAFSGYNITTASVYDNFYVQHMIPRSDNNYSWIKNATYGKTQNFHGYIPYNGLFSSSEGTISGVNFITRSLAGSYILGNRKFALDGRVYSASLDTLHVHFTDFAGLNDHIVSVLDTSSNTIGTSSLTENVNNDYIDAYVTTPDGKSRIFNAILLNRGSLYKFSSWQQVRNNYNPFVRYERRTNRLSLLDPNPSVEIITYSDNTTETVTPKYGTLNVFERTMPVASRYAPIKQTVVYNVQEIANPFNLDVPPPDGAPPENFDTHVSLLSSYGNILSTFDNESLDRLVAPIDTPTLPYHVLRDEYIKQNLSSGPEPSLKNISGIYYQETVFPSAINMYTTRVRGRTEYDNGFWRDSRTERNTLGSATKNSAGLIVSASCWPLDQIDGFGGGTWVVAATSSKAGELQNTYTHVHNDIPENNTTAATAASFFASVINVTASALYSRKHTLATIDSVVHPAGIPIPQTQSAVPTKHREPNLAKIISELGGGGTGSFAFLGEIQNFYGEAKWEAGDHAGYIEESFSDAGELTKSFVSASQAPWRDSYEDFNYELRLKKKDYSVVPEFRISEHIEQLNDNDNIYSEIFNIFDIPHASVTASTPQNSSKDDFYTIFSNSDFLKRFAGVKDDHKDLLQLDKVSLTCKVLKKFIPYNGFYPAQRTLQMATQLSKSYGKYVNGNIYSNSTKTSTNFAGTYDGSNAHYRPFITPLFAPGIMYNTIKSGIAVDWPVMLTGSKINPQYIYNAQQDPGKISGYWGLTSPIYNELSGSHITISTNLNPSDDYIERIESVAQQVFEVEGVASTQLSFTASNPPWQETWDYRIPFEAIVEPEKYMSEIPLFDYESARHAKINVTSSWSGDGDNLYKLMTSNFLAEVPDFFLENSSFTSLASAPVNTTGIEFTSGSIWGARVKVRRSMNEERDWSLEHGYFDTSHKTWTKDFSFELPQDPKKQSRLQETFTMYSRPSAFGPPCLGRLHHVEASSGYHPCTHTGRTNADIYAGYRVAVSASISGSMDSLDGYSWAYTPPYYHGECWLDIIFEPDCDGNLTKTYTLDEILNESRRIPWRVDAGIEDPRPTTAINAEGSSDGLTGSAEPRVVPNNNHSNFHNKANISGLEPAGLYAGRNVNANAMQIESSFKLGIRSIGDLGGPDDLKTEYFVIEPKFETPMLNFGPSSSRGISALTEGTLTIPTFGSASVPRGMWHQFGLIPEKDDGVFLEIGNIPQSWLQNHPSIQYDTRYGENSVYKTTEGGPDVAAASDSEGVYSAMLNRLLLPERLESLTEKLGFEETSKKLGGVAPKKIVKEAIVAVPFLQIDNERKFFPISRDLIDTALALEAGDIQLNFGETRTGLTTVTDDDPVGESIKQMVSAMPNYVFPPTMNFIDDRELEPFAMYIFEFEHEFTQLDLANMWQNLPPFDHDRMREEKVTITHLFGENEFFDASDFSDKTQWMVFKVKQRAKTNYYDKVATSPRGTELTTMMALPEDQRLQSLSAMAQSIGIQPEQLVRTPKIGNGSVMDYSYNWPYDYFSTIELAQVDVGVELDNPNVDDPPEDLSLTPTEISTGVIITGEMTAQSLELSSTVENSIGATEQAKKIFGD